MSEQDKRAVSICEAMADIPRATSPRTPLIWAYEVKAQRDELLAVLIDVANEVAEGDSNLSKHIKDNIFAVLDKYEAEI